MSNKNYEEGKAAAVAYYKSQGYAALTRHIKPEDAMKLFLLPIKESMTQIATPLPKDRLAWINGFRDQQAVIQGK